MHVNGELVGKLVNDVLRDLGGPDRETVDGTLIYVLGPDSGFGIDIWEMHIACDKAGIVRTTEIKAY